ncbi:MAG: hypothetical protein L0H54_11875 [Alcaligenaceae bacterium]|nr:hypothetical protein [Alcaligenaceae bacterium]
MKSKILALSCLVPLMWVASHVPAQGSGANPETWEVESVRELMRLDMERALEQRRQSSGRAITATEPVGAWQAPRLVAMYGVGRKLMAEVLVGSHPYLYIRGQAHPVGHGKDPDVYQLRGMTGSCVQLQRAQVSHSLCLHALLTAGQP